MRYCVSRETSSAVNAHSRRGRSGGISGLSRGSLENAWPKLYLPNKNTRGGWTWRSAAVASSRRRRAVVSTRARWRRGRSWHERRWRRWWCGEAAVDARAARRRRPNEACQEGVVCLPALRWSYTPYCASTPRVSTVRCPPPPRRGRRVFIRHKRRTRRAWGRAALRTRARASARRAARAPLYRNGFVFVFAFEFEFEFELESHDNESEFDFELGSRDDESERARRAPVKSRLSNSPPPRQTLEQATHRWPSARRSSRPRCAAARAARKARACAPGRSAPPAAGSSTRGSPHRARAPAAVPRTRRAREAAGARGRRAVMPRRHVLPHLGTC